MPVELGMVHGRFQPLHIEHLQYILRGLGRCSHLVVGITNPEASEYQADSLSPHRHQEQANPYTYFQRSEMVRECLVDERVDLARVSIVPFHLFDPERWRYYLPSPGAVVQFVRAFSGWEDKKIELFRTHGFRIDVLDRRMPKNVEGKQVRNLMDAAGNWRQLVPPGTARVIDRLTAGEL
jgi:nicotinamide mononucleotide adenylyltransferase